MYETDIVVIFILSLLILKGIYVFIELRKEVIFSIYQMLHTAYTRTKMATYKEIQNYIKDKHMITVKTCWIAHVKEIKGIHMRKASNRISTIVRVSPCPQKHVQIIMDALNHFDINES